MGKGIAVGSCLGFVIGLAITLSVDRLTSVPLEYVIMLNVMAPLVLACGFAVYFVQRWW